MAVIVGRHGQRLLEQISIDCQRVSHRFGRGKEWSWELTRSALCLFTLALCSRSLACNDAFS